VYEKINEDDVDACGGYTIQGDNNDQGDNKLKPDPKPEPESEPEPCFADLIAKLVGVWVGDINGFTVVMKLDELGNATLLESYMYNDEATWSIENGELLVSGYKELCTICSDPEKCFDYDTCVFIKGEFTTSKFYVEFIGEDTVTLECVAGINDTVTFERQCDTTIALVGAWEGFFGFVDMTVIFNFGGSIEIIFNDFPDVHSYGVWILDCNEISLEVDGFQWWWDLCVVSDSLVTYNAELTGETIAFSIYIDLGEYDLKITPAIDAVIMMVLWDEHRFKDFDEVKDILYCCDWQFEGRNECTFWCWEGPITIGQLVLERQQESVATFTKTVI